MRLDEVILNAYLDGELSQPERRAVETLLSESAEARAMLARLEEDTALINYAFEPLNPPPESRSSARLSLRRLQVKLASTAQAVDLNSPKPVKEASMVWESPSLLTELKTWLNQLRYNWKRPAGPALLATIALLVVVGLGLFWWPGLSAIQPKLSVTALPTTFPVQETAIPTPIAELDQAGAITLPAAPRFNDAIELLGYKLSAETILPGDTLAVTLYWRSLRPVTTDYAVFVHLRNEDLTTLAQHDAQPDNWQSPTSGWQPGQLVADEHLLPIPAGLEAGSYELLVGMYDGATGQRMNVVRDGALLPEAAVPLPPVFIESTDPATDYIVALQPIPQGTVITADLIGQQSWKVNFPVPDRVVDEAEVIGKMARANIAKGQVIERGMLAEAATSPSSQSCPVTLPSAQPFIPPEPYPPEPPGPSFWFGNESLWTALPVDGVWTYLPHNPDGYTQKLLWWRVGYSWTEEPEPALNVTGHRLDDPTVTLLALPATNAFAPDIQSAMLIGVDFPTPGCWQITGRYAEAELSYIVKVDP